MILNNSDLNKEKIDYVFPYVNFKDSEWKNKYFNYLKKIGKEFDSEEQKRHVDNIDIIKYSLRSIDRYLPWINNVYLIVDNIKQVPEYLDQTKLNVITHNQILPENMMPCFSSTCIEHYIPKISGLSEKFLYGNDDFLALKPLTQNMFFTDDGKLNVKIKKYKTSYKTMYSNTLRNSWKLVYNSYNIPTPDDLKYYAYEQNNIHTFRPQFKKVRLEILNKFKDEISATFNPIRWINDLMQLETPYYYLNGYMTNKVVLPDNFHKYIKIKTNQDYKNFSDIINANNCYTAVINECNDKFSENVKKILDKKFNFKSKYEK